MKKKLKEICTQIRGVSYKPSDVRDEFSGIPILRANNIQDTGIVFDELVYVDSSKVHSEQYLLTDDIVICASSGSKNLVGKAASYKSDLNASFGAFCKVVRINNSDDLCKAYIQQYFQSKIYRNAISESSAGANINNIKTEDIEALEIPLPSKEEQQKIAAELDKIQSAIDNKKQQLALLDEAVKSEFVEMFGENPVEGGRWKVERLGDCGTFKNGMNYSPNENGVDILCLNVSDFKDNYKIQDCKTLSSISLNEEPSSEYYLQNDDIVFVRSNGNKKLVGRCVALYPNDCKVLFSGFCIRFRKSTDNLNTDFLLHFLNTDLTREQLKGKGANIQNLNQQILANLHLPVPPLDLQIKFAAFVQQIDEAKSLAKQQIADLQELLDSKMQQYFA